MPTVTQTANDQQQQTDAPAHKLARPDFGEGRYSPLMNECFDDLQTVFGLNVTDAEKVSRKIASDFGAHMSAKGVGLDHIKVGKANKDNKVTLREAGQSVKGVTLTWGLFILKGLLFAADAGNHGFLHADTKWKATPNMQKCIDNICKPKAG